MHDASRRPLLQDGPGWWTARARSRAWRRPRPPPYGVRGPGSGSVNAFLLCRDQLVERLNDRGLRILRLALLGHPQKEIAEIEEITRSAVSQQFSRGVGTIVDAHTFLDDHRGLMIALGAFLRGDRRLRPAAAPATRSPPGTACCSSASGSPCSRLRWTRAGFDPERSLPLGAIWTVGLVAWLVASSAALDAGAPRTVGLARRRVPPRGGRPAHSSPSAAP